MTNTPRSRTSLPARHVRPTSTARPTAGARPISIKRSSAVVLPALVVLAFYLLPVPAALGRQQVGTILFLGDSLSAGYGLPQEQAFPALIGERLRELDLPYEVLNAGVPGDTSAGGLRRIDWLLRRPIDILFLELGANDMLRGLPLDTTRANLQAIIDKARAANPDVLVVVAGMLAPPNMGPEYSSEFRDLFPALAAANDAVLMPFLLQSVAARPELNQADGIHPNVEGQKIVADDVWEVLEPLLDDGAERRTATLRRAATLWRGATVAGARRPRRQLRG